MTTTLTVRAETEAAISGLEVFGPEVAQSDRVLTREALAFLLGLARAFEARRQDLLARRRDVQGRLDAGALPDFLPETAELRAADWNVAAPPADLLDRRVEITGPTDRKMVINALNSGANVFMADFEDSNSPTWANLVAGQANLIDAVEGTIAFVAPETGKRYRLAERVATLMVRPRGWHLPEKHVRLDGRPVSASLFDFALFFFHNARRLLGKGTGPYFYLPKMESHLEARLWNDVFVAAQETLGIPRGTIRATVLVETLPAAFEMDEILWELREHSAGLNCGRWDYIFSFLKKLRARPESLLPDRGRVTMDRHFLRSYSELLIRTCHRRGIHAMGGMAAQIPIKDDPMAHHAAIEKVVADKKREAAAGHDGTWVAHPGLVATAMGVFDEAMPGPHQIARLREDVAVSASDLLAVPEGPITEAGLRHNVNVGIRYLAAWLTGSGCVPLDHLMEDAATAEISRAQVWQWIRHGARLEDGVRVTRELYREIRRDETKSLEKRLGRPAWKAGRYELAASLFDRLIEAEDFEDFLTLPAYDELLKLETSNA
ncbi:MAG TPA: malate synthase A [Thermoanaerobaculia bacterium]|jgi:malate synthase